MLNPFPHLLDYGIYAPTLLRIAAACIVFYISWRVFQEAKTIAGISFPLVGKTKPWIQQLAALITALVGIALFVGYSTQVAAILAILISLKLTYFRKKLESVILLPCSTYVLLSIICLSLLLTGAGALAFDLPL